MREKYVRDTLRYHVYLYVIFLLFMWFFWSSIKQFKVPGSQILESRVLKLRSRVQVPGPGTWILGPESRVVGPRSWALGPYFRLCCFVQKVEGLLLEYSWTPIEHYRALFSILTFFIFINNRKNDQPGWYS